MELFKIEVCNGNSGCPNSLTSTENIVHKLYQIAVSENLEEFIRSKIKGPIRQHHCFRVSIANCPNACSQVQIKDMGIVAKVKIEINRDSCINCGKCAKVCFEGALIFKDKNLSFYREKCIGCGMCVKVCKEEAIDIVQRGFQVLAGGKLGRHAMLAFEIAQFVTLEKTIDIFKKLINYYKEYSIFGERLGAIFQRLKLSESDVKKLFS